MEQQHNQSTCINEFAYEQKPFVPRRISRGTELLLVASCVCFAMKLVLLFLTDRASFLFSNFGINLLDIKGFENSLVLFSVLGLIFGLLGLIRGIWRIPTPQGRIREELKLALWSLRIIPADHTTWRAFLTIYPNFKWNRKSRVMKLHFAVRSVRANLETLKEIEQSEAFRHVQSIEIVEHINRNGRRNGYDLYLNFEEQKKMYDRLFGRS